jgi:hypothetical protein
MMEPLEKYLSEVDGRIAVMKERIQEGRHLFTPEITNGFMDIADLIKTLKDLLVQERAKNARLEKQLMERNSGI